MNERLLAAIRKEILLFLRDPKSRAMLLMLPVLQVIIFGLAATLDVNNVELAIVNRDSGKWSREFIHRLDAARFVASATHLQSSAELAELIETRQVLLGLVFPADFSRDLAAGSPASVQVLIDGRRANAGQVTASYLGSIAADLGVELDTRQGGAQPPRVESRNWFNTNLNYRWFMVPNLSATMSMMIALLITALSISRERELGTFDQLLVSPSSPLEIILSKTIPAVLAGGVVGMLIVVVAVFGFGIPFRGNFWLFAAAMLPFVFSVVGVGLVISSLVKTQQQAILGLFFTLMPFMLISGFATPVENMPQWLQYVAQISPLKHFLLIVQGSFLKSIPPQDVWSNTWPLFIIAAVTFSSATFFVSRRLQ